MAAMVDSFPRTATEMPQFYPEDPGDIVRSKPASFIRERFSSQAQAPAPDISSPHTTHSIEETEIQTPTTPTEVKSKELPIHTDSQITRQDSQPEIQVLPPEDPKFEDSTTAILRHYSAEKNGRPASFHLSASGRPKDEPAMSEMFRVGGKACLVTLEEDLIKWSRRLAPGKQSAQVNTLYLSDLFAVVHGAPLPSSSQSLHSRQPSVSSLSTTSTLPRPTRSSTPTQGLEFTLHALKSVPGSVGKLVRVTFRGQSANTCQMWAEKIMHQMYNFGNRPRRLYVIVNPVSGSGGRGSTEKLWNKVQHMFRVGQIVTDVTTTTQRFHARELLQSLDLSLYDGVVTVGGDGLFNEVMNGLLIKTQQQGGVNMRNPRFFPLTPNIRLGVIPTGYNNSIARSVFGCRNPFVAAAQIMLGCSSPIDVCSVSQNNQLLLFSAGPMAYGFWSDAALFSQDLTWLGSRRFDFATIKTLFSRHEFEAEIQFVPAEDPEEVVRKGEKCFNRCPKCNNFDSHTESPSAANEKGACLMAVHSEVDRVDDRQWKTITGHFTSVMACPHVCCGLQAPRGLSPFGHLGNGSTDLIMLSRCSMFEHAKWLLKQRRGEPQFDHPFVHIRRVKEYRFREILKPARGSRAVSENSQEPEDVDVRSMDNLMEQDDDEVTNRRAQQSGPGPALPTSRWNIDGDELPRADIDVRVHRQLLSVFARGPEPIDPDSASSSQTSMDQQDRTDQDDLIPSPK